ncbi:tRNA-intron lyase [Candidatus Pacearchaeota archaeon]|nr:tRNA-intron lyase [Candidatus Pacearchaeota archaeon]
MKKIQAILLGKQITSNSSEAYALLEKSQFGEKQNQKIFYSLTEAFFLIEDNKMQIFDFRNNLLTESQLLKKFQHLDKNFIPKYLTFKDLRKKGYIVKTALKFGAEFRIYEKGKRISESHSKWLCYPIQENQSIKWQDFAAKNRIAHSSKKKLLIAIIDEENQISYYETNWIKP